MFLAGCKGIFTKEAWEFIGEIVDFIRIVVPIALIILASVDLANGMLNGKSSNEDTFKKIAYRFVAAVLVFLVPTILKLILNLPPVKSSLNLVDDPLCEKEMGLK